MDSSRFDCQAGEYYIGGRETRSLLEAENSDHIGDHKVEEMQLVQPQFQETPCCPQMPWLYLVMAAVMAALGGVLFGYDIGIVSGAILQLRLKFELNCIKQEMVVSSMLMGAVVASLTGGFIVDFIGRRMAIIINAAIFLAGAVILACAPSFPVLVVGRFVVGFGVSLSAIAECIYISEIAPPDRRGLLVSFNEVGICVGILLAYSVNAVFIDLPSGWRFMFGLSGIPAIIQGVGMYFLPHSPRWLLLNGQDEKACRIIQKLGLSRDPNEELAKIKSGLNVEYHYKFGDLFSTTDNMRKRMLVGGGVVFFQQFTGQPAIVYYASTIFQALGFQSSEKATLASLGIGLAKIFCTVISLSTMDKGGRRRFLLIGVSCMAVSVLTLGIVAHYTSLGHAERKCHFTPHSSSTISHVSSTTTNSTSFSFVSLSSVNTTDPTPALASKGLRYFTLSALVLFVGAYSFSFGPVSWLLLSEIFPAGIKGRAFSIATVLNWGTNLVVSLTFLDMLSTLGASWTFIFYTVNCIVGLIFIYKYVPETKNRSLEQISAEFNTRKSRQILPKKLHCFSRKRRRQLREEWTPGGSTTDMLLSNSC
ncbi:solute carrier family 2, facilitated glucose transporter member 12-like isoform X1 [Acropora millepora]|uniref:solute carrier family 2, facilitated glucose transporter member 12-like isoform X1 n=1 Tax=Acropora millepora TaxID=45264 RepID=UPI001CF36F64|nr:solute carrier family 2, facilitated glucose transporter member 12-like isoform X1 [Acropora millepora]